MTTLPLVSAEWLNERLNDENLIILDATLAKPTSAEALPNQNIQIPGTQFFDINGAFSDGSNDLPHMMCSESQFQQEIRKLGISDDKVIVIYDSHGVYSSPRAWWMLKSMGLNKTYVLDGGLSEWVEKGLTTEDKSATTKKQGQFEACFDAHTFWDKDQVLSAIENEDVAVIDARSSGRFYGTAPEPREGLRGGHIPNSISLPFSDVLEGTRMKSKEELKSIFSSLNVKDQKLVFTCGSGLTACIILLAAHIAEYEGLAVYDGSWSEWGQPSDLPVNK